MSSTHRLEVLGGEVVYEIVGESGDLVVMTPGGRFSKDIPGLRPLAEAVAAGGHRVLLWDRPNCGASDVQFFGTTESHMRAAVLAGLLRALGTGPVVIAGGSGGARDSMLTVMLYPELCTRLVVWNIVGGVYGSFSLGAHYVLPTIAAVRTRGMEGVLEVPEWQERVAANPRNRDRLLAFSDEEFLRIMLRWLNAFVPKPGQTIPGVDDDGFNDIRVPTLIIRGGELDLHHPKRTSLEVNTLIKGSTLIDPPWHEDAWNMAARDRAYGKVTGYNMFDTWVEAAPAILSYLGR